MVNYRLEKQTSEARGDVEINLFLSYSKFELFTKFQSGLILELITSFQSKTVQFGIFGRKPLTNSRLALNKKN